MVSQCPAPEWHQSMPKDIVKTIFQKQTKPLYPFQYILHTFTSTNYENVLYKLKKYQW